MNIPPKYEDVVAQLENERVRITDYIAQRAQTELQLDAALGREAALREELEALRESYEAMRDRKNSIVDLQQRLTVAEQRAAVMEKALSRIAREHDCGCSPCTGSCTSQVALEITVDAMRDIAIAALKPAEGEVS